MAVFKDLKITVVKVEGNCNRQKVGSTFFIRNAKLYIPNEDSICVFALGSIMQIMTAAMMKPKQENKPPDIYREWQCPDPFAKVIFKIEEE